MTPGVLGQSRRVPQVPGQPRQLAIAVEEVVAESQRPQPEHVAKHIFADPREVVVIQSPVDSKSGLLKLIPGTSKRRIYFDSFVKALSVKSTCLFLEGG